MKNKILILGIAVLILAMLLVTAMPGNSEDNGKGKRVIADTTSSIDKFIFRMKGCTIVHELNDATALKCPAGVQIEGAFEDKVYHITDMDANVQINADDVWSLSYTGEGVTVAVLDTGIDTDHPELVGDIVGGQSFVEYTTSYEDDHSHGTHVSGIITADGVGGTPLGYAKGVAPDAGIWMAKVCDSGGSCYLSDIAAAIQHVVYNTPYKIMSISLGGGNFAGENCDGDYLASKVNWAVSEGVTVVAAAGNDRFYVSSPACASGAIAVGAVDKNSLMASFSNFGTSLDIVAPGVSIYSSIIDRYDSWSGTSMSTPHVSAVVALVLDANPSLTVDEIKTALYETADPINPDSVCYGVVKKAGPNYWIGVVPCSSDNYGAGIVDAYGAVNYVPTTTTTTTTIITTTTTILGGCGDEYCAGADIGEDCTTCSVDCIGKTTGKPSGRYCCGNYVCESAGENADNCPVDCV
ncbi:MAG: S8 family serine peptidase [Candidatus Altiarchaeales archaeon]|nr:S8 family serine peptidase [Candidatus Altiarchaeota archaeon]MCG2782730.1 S8 family serine peptidase [Candidatus Altiarchaeales archaeon]MCG2827468.1 S8 family serine peptidase [Thermoplasmatales archaeon]MBU4341108.1 S8 family serine peptidase [Candidatus Altiarchaeota archaeon]MBU4406442.1 S8 family serine peptidase [Candidatus Altiarchaeota archaeon]